jgi:hypothetical protein
MTLSLNQANWDELHQQAPKLQLDNLVYDDLNHITGIPECIGRGSNRNIEISPGLCLSFYDCEYQQDLIVSAPVHEHDIQIVYTRSFAPLSGFDNTSIEFLGVKSDRSWRLCSSSFVLKRITIRAKPS